MFFEAGVVLALVVAAAAGLTRDRSLRAGLGGAALGTWTAAALVPPWVWIAAANTARYRPAAFSGLAALTLLIVAFMVLWRSISRPAPPWRAVAVGAAAGFGACYGLTVSVAAAVVAFTLD